uniref:CEMIP beta-helix domain-containing protein n=1 Tax=Mucochytrium quahogii TaxID=96639 RepID=A0A7S2S122_9STRA|mmetsp:Transcript_23038/g.50241  ORF Transcript_23038/g.50241 Transcript_23038/m.50241 type:complete len:1245 (+) Transcript_23038:75-3809(+)
MKFITTATVGAGIVGASKAQTNKFGLVSSQPVGIGGDTIHVSSPQEWEFGKIKMGEHSTAHLKMAIGHLPVYVEPFTAKFRRPRQNAGNLFQLHMRIPRGIEAGEHNLTVLVDGEEISLPSLQSYISNQHLVGESKQATVTVYPAVDGVNYEVHKNRFHVSGSGFSRTRSNNEVRINGQACSVEHADLHHLLVDCNRTVGKAEKVEPKQVVERGMYLELNHEGGMLETVAITDDVEWPASSPHVNGVGQYQPGTFVANARNGSFVKVPASGYYTFKAECTSCLFQIGNSTDMPVYLRAGVEYPYTANLVHSVLGDQFRLSAELTTDLNKSSDIPVLAFHPVPAEWFGVRTTTKPVVQLTVNGYQASCRGGQRSLAACDNVTQIYTKRHEEPMAPPPAFVDVETKSLLGDLDGGRRLLETKGRVLMSDWAAQNGCTNELADCVIPAGETIIMDTNLDIRSLTIKGELLWSTTSESLQLRTGYVFVEENGLFHLDAKASSEGTLQTIYIKNNGATNECTNSFRGFGTCAASSESAWNPVMRVEGRPLARTWSLLSRNADKGASTITLEHAPADMGWKAGDRIVIAPSGIPSKSQSNFVGPEVFKIERFDGNVVHLSGSTNQVYLGDSSKQMQSEVINMNRNVLITGDDFVPIRGTDSVNGLHGISFNEGGYVELKHTKIEKCGQRDVSGKYCMHLHQKQICRECKIIGNAIEEGQQRGIATHGTHHSLVEDNVLYKVRGAGFYIEDGDEMENDFVNNVNICHATGADSGACKATGTNNPDSDDVFQSGIWALSVSNNFYGNRLVNHQNGFFGQTSTFPKGKAFAANLVCTMHAYMGKYKGNVCHSNWRYGFSMDNNYPRNIRRSPETRGHVTDIDECYVNPEKPCSCEEFTADGSDNGVVGTIEDSLNWGNEKTGQYDAGDISFVSSINVNNKFNVEWMGTKNFVDGSSSHYKDSTFGYYADTGMPEYDSFGDAHILTPGTPGAFILENNTFFGRMKDGAIVTDAHCGNIITGLCTTSITLVNNDFTALPADTKLISYASTGSNVELPTVSTFGARLHSDVVSVASKYMIHLLDVTDTAGNKVCRFASELKLETLLGETIVCSKPLRRLQLWTPLGEIATPVNIQAPGGGLFTMKFLDPCDGKMLNSNNTDTTCFPGYGAPVVADDEQRLRYTIHGADDAAGLVFEFSDTVYGDRFQSPDKIALSLGNRHCDMSSQHSRKFIGPYGPQTSMVHIGACLPEIKSLRQ